MKNYRKYLPFNNEKLRIIVSLLFILCLQEGTLHAQSLSIFDTVQVKTSRLPLKLSETGRNITILKGRDLQKMAFTSLDDVLQYIPGIEVQTRGAFGVQGDISLRGATFTQVMILVNGMKLNDPLTGHFNSYIPVTPAEIERIEVLRGAASAMYGADAVGGVINIITRSFSGNGSDESTVEGVLNYGEERLVNAQQGFSVQREKWYVGGGFSTNQSDGQTVAAQQIGDTNLDSYRSFFNLKTLGLSVGYRMNDQWTLEARTAYDDRNFDARYFYTTSTFDKSVETTQNWWNQVKVTRMQANQQTDIQFAYRRGTDEFIFSPDFPSTNIHTTHFWNTNVNHLFLLNERTSIRLGGQIDYRSVESTDRGDHSDWHYGAYATGSLRPISNLTLIGSLRLDHDDNYGLEFTPQVNLSYGFANMTLRASAGRSIRAADYTERYVSFNLENLTPGRSLGNPDLMAESAWSEEIGLDIKLSNSWQLKTTAFARQSDNLIDFVSTNEADISNNSNLQADANYFYATNVTSVQTRGVELESWVRQSLRENTHLQWSLGYTYLNTSNEEDVISVYIASHAKHLLSTNLILESGRWNVALNGLYKVRNEQVAAGINARLAPSYQLWNLRLGYNLNEQFGLNFQIHNLFDESYQNILGAAMPNRWLMGGVRFRL
ncbi:MAG: TonB-dependent receptor [Bacteroidota bacterium]